MTTEQIKERARQVVAQFSHVDGGIEWVTNPNPDKLRAAIAAAITEAADAARLEGLEVYRNLAYEFCYQLCDEKWGENVDEHTPPCQQAQERIAELEAKTRAAND